MVKARKPIERQNFDPFIRKHSKVLGRTRRPDLVERYYSKVRYWLKRKIPFRVEGHKVIIPSKGIEFVVIDFEPETFTVELTHVLEHPFVKEMVLCIEKIIETDETGKTIVRFLLVEKSKEYENNIYDADIEYRGKKFICSHTGWEDIAGKKNEETFGRIGLGTLMDYLRLRELSRLGIKEWKTKIDKTKSSIGFADFRRFNKVGRSGYRTRKVPQLEKTKKEN